MILPAQAVSIIGRCDSAKSESVKGEAPVHVKITKIGVAICIVFRVSVQRICGHLKFYRSNLGVVVSVSADSNGLWGLFWLKSVFGASLQPMVSSAADDKAINPLGISQLNCFIDYDSSPGRSRYGIRHPPDESPFREVCYENLKLRRP